MVQISVQRRAMSNKPCAFGVGASLKDWTLLVQVIRFDPFAQDADSARFARHRRNQRLNTWDRLIDEIRGSVLGRLKDQA